MVTGGVVVTSGMSTEVFAVGSNNGKGVTDSGNGICLLTIRGMGSRSMHR